MNERAPRSHQNQRAIFSKSLAKVIQDSIPVNKFDTHQVNIFAWHSEGTGTSRPQNWMEMVSFCSLIKLIFVVVAIIRQMVAGMELTVIFLLIPVSRCFAYRQWRFLCANLSSASHDPHRSGCTHSQSAPFPFSSASLANMLVLCAPPWQIRCTPYGLSLLPSSRLVSSAFLDSVKPSVDRYR